MRVTIASATCVLFLLTGTALTEGPDNPPSSFSKAKRLARDTVYAGRPLTFYCGCHYVPTGSSGGIIDRSDCGYSPHNDSARARQLECECCCAHTRAMCSPAK